MSMHQIEDMIESTVRLLAGSVDSRANDIPPRDICYHLYRMQDQCDCGYTMLRVEEQLIQMGFLARVPIEQLPEHERDAARSLTDRTGFLPSGAYIDGEQELAYVAYGKPIWNTLAETGVLSQPQITSVTKMDVLALAEVVMPLAAGRLAAGGKAGETAAEVLLYWYALLPAMMLTTGYDGEGEEERVLRLRNLAAAPEIFKRVHALRLTSELEDLDDLVEEDLPCLSGWAEPYLQWAKEEAGKTKKRCRTIPFPNGTGRV